MGKRKTGPESRSVMTDECEAPAWVASFLSGLIVTGSVREAVAESGTDFETAWALRREYPVFAMYWDRAMRVHKSVMAGVPFFDAVAAAEVELH